MKKIVVNFIGTGNYLKFFPKYYETFMEYFVPECYKHFFVFTDGELGNDIPENITLVPSEETVKITKSDYSSSNWYNLMHKSIGGLKRFGEIKKIKEQILDYDWFVYFDADMYCYPKIITYDEFFNDQKDYFGVQHPTQNIGMFEYCPSNKDQFPFERNQKSLSSVKVEEQIDDIYIQGCVWGGKIPEIFNMIEELDEKIIIDIENNIITIAHDESYLNRFRFDNIKNFHVLSPSFAKPGDIPSNQFNFSARIIHSPHDKKIILNS